MTREEAIERFENVKANALVQKASGVSEYWQTEIEGTVEAIDMAIEALQAEPPHMPMFKESEEAYKAWTGEDMGKTHGRLIDADALMEEMLCEGNHYDNDDIRQGYHDCECLVYEAPTVSADRQTGEWRRNKTYKNIVFCSECGMPYEDYVKPRNFCPNCGADMRGGDEKSNGFTADEWYRNTFKGGDE